MRGKARGEEHDSSFSKAVRPVGSAFIADLPAYHGHSYPIIPSHTDNGEALWGSETSCTGPRVRHEGGPYEDDVVEARTRSRGLITCLGLTAVIASVLLAGCGGSKSATPTATPSISLQRSYLYVPHNSTVPPCAGPLHSEAFPKGFPQNFPVPPGTSINNWRVPIGGGIAVTGAIPSNSFASSVHFYPTLLPHRGYKILHVEIDAPHDTEGSFHGHGYYGGWSMQSIPGCKAMNLQIEVQNVPVK